MSDNNNYQILQHKTISNLKALPIFLAFFCMGFGDVVGPLVGLVKSTFALSNFQAQLLPFTGWVYLPQNNNFRA